MRSPNKILARHLWKSSATLCLVRCLIEQGHLIQDACNSDGRYTTGDGPLGNAHTLLWISPYVTFIDLRLTTMFFLQLLVGAGGALGGLWVYEHKLRAPIGGNSQYHELSMDTGF